LYSPVLATEKVKESHTGENIASALSNIFNEWNISNKIVTIVSDNGANIKHAINDHLLKYHHPCVAHTLNLSVNESINKNTEFLRVLKICRAIVGHFKHSNIATEKLKEFQKQMGLPELKVKQDVSTRWNSSLNMITDCSPILKPFESFTIELSGEKYPTLSLVIPLVKGLQYTVRKVRPKTDAGILLPSSLLDVVSRRLGSLEKNKVVSKSTLLDPKLKKTAFRLEDNANNAQQRLVDELTSIISINNGANENNIENINETPTSLTSTDSSYSLWDHFD